MNVKLVSNVIYIDHMSSMLKCCLENMLNVVVMSNVCM